MSALHACKQRLSRALRPSLQGELLAWSLGSLLLVWLAHVVIGYATGHHEADELTDGHLASVAAIVLAKDVDGFGPAPDVAALVPPDTLHAHDYQQSLSAVVWDEMGTVRARIGTAPLPPFDTEEGFHTLRLAHTDADMPNPISQADDTRQSATPWRVFVRWDEHTPAGSYARKVAVLLDMQERDELARDIAEQIALPGLYLLPLVAAVLILAVRRGLRPLHALSAQVRQLDIYQPQALNAPPHGEFQSMVAALNLLAQRYATAVRHERETADLFAHELRTPLTSLRLHVGNLRRAGGEESRLNNTSQAKANTASRMAFDATLAQIEADTDRAATVLRDLLALARASRLQLGQASQALDLAELARRVVAEYGQAALDARHGLVLHVAQAAPMHGHPVLLEIALRNLLDNALAHTPAGTCITVAVSAAPLWLQVCDNARPSQQPQQPQQKKDHTRTQPPHRQSVHSAGLGLGHQVVRRIAEAHGGSFDVIHVPDNPPLRGWRLTFGLTSADANRTT